LPYKLKTLIDVAILNVLIDFVCKIVLERQPATIKLCFFVVIYTRVYILTYILIW